ncbi:MAG: ComEC/Rec2 family competence protein [Bdellovibrionales bacterium]|nr:ComEC/Rec2 family competence protein [Bdellovibrionales bacterium]
MRWLPAFTVTLLVMAALVRWQQEKRTHRLLCGELANLAAIGQPVLVEGTLRAHPSGWLFRDALVWIAPGRGYRVKGVWVWAGFAGPWRYEGRIGSARVRLRCGARLKNGPYWGEIPSLSGGGVWVGLRAGGWEIRSRWQQAISARLLRWPTLWGLSLAIWTGDASAVGGGLLNNYREWGMGHVLALSGQHVLILSSTLLYLLGQFFRMRSRRWANSLRSGLPLLICAFLWLTSGGAPSVQRVTFLGFAARALKHFGLWAPPLQRLSSSVALLVLWDPELVGSVGFGLSVVMSYCLFEIGEPQFRSRIWEYVWIQAVMALLSAPLAAYYFCRFNFGSILANLLLGFLWSLVLIPLAFLSPLFASIFPDFILDCFESALAFFFEWQTKFEFWRTVALVTVPRPHWYELVLSETFLLAVAHQVKRYLFRLSRPLLS